MASNRALKQAQIPSAPQPCSLVQFESALVAETATASRNAGAVKSSVPIAMLRMNLLDASLRCTEVSCVLDEILAVVPSEFLPRSVSWSVADECYVCHGFDGGRFHHRIGLTLDDQPFGRLVIYTDRQVNPSEWALLEQTVPVVAYPLRILRLLAKARLEAEHDALTGLRNRRSFDDFLLKRQAYLRRYNRPVSLLIIDMVDFKTVNDTMGHDVGDRALQTMGDVLRNTMRETDYGFRIGGDEFAVILPETEYAGGEVFARRLEQALARTPVVCAENKRLTLSLAWGLAQLRPEETLDSWFRRADQHLYHQKSRQRGRMQQKLV